MPAFEPHPVRHLAPNRWGYCDKGLCGATRAKGVGIVKSRRQTTCRECIALHDARRAEAIAGRAPKAPAFTR